MGLSNSKNNSDTINWNGIKTDNISSPMPNFNGLSTDAKKLIASLNIPQITESETSEGTINHILDKIQTGLNKDDQSKFNQLLDHVSKQNNEEMTDSSPFISSEMYDYLINNKGQRGGSKQRGGNFDDSDTSSTSSDSDLEEILESNEEDIKKKKESKKHKSNKLESEIDTELSGGELSYLSSSAHTDREFSDSESSNETTSEAGTTQNEATTVTDENEYQNTSSASVNTEDINMVSDYE